jgi:DHA1 family multidrug resistance protein-like MFS transporter
VETAPASRFSPARFLGLCAVDFSARLSYNMARTPVLPLFAAALGAPPEWIGAIVAASTVTGIFLKAPAGAFSDHFGRRRTLLLGACFFAFTPFFYVFVGWAAALLVIRVVHGVATSIYGPVAEAVAAELAGDRKGEVLSWFSLIKIGTNAVGGLAGAAVLQFLGGQAPSLGDFHKAYGAAGAAGLAALVIAVVVLPGVTGAEPDRKRSFRESYRKLWKGIFETFTHGRVMIAASAESVQNMTMGALQAFLPVYAVQKEVGLSIIEAGFLWSMVTGTSLVSKPVMGRISDRYGRRWVIALGLLFCGVPFALIPWFTGFWPLAALAVVFGLGEAFVTSSTAALTADVSKRESLGAAMGVFGTVADAGQALGPIAVGFLIAAADYRTAFGALGAVLVLWTVVFLGLAGKDRAGAP